MALSELAPGFYPERMLYLNGVAKLVEKMNISVLIFVFIPLKGFHIISEGNIHRGGYFKHVYCS